CLALPLRKLSPALVCELARLLGQRRRQLGLRDRELSLQLGRSLLVLVVDEPGESRSLLLERPVRLGPPPHGSIVVRRARGRGRRRSRSSPPSVPGARARSDGRAARGSAELRPRLRARALRSPRGPLGAGGGRAKRASVARG